MNIENTLQERGARYGTFEDHAYISQLLKNVISSSLKKKNKRLADDQHEALDMIAHKMVRILNGDPDYADSWHDIAGYAQLIADRLNGDAK